MTPTTSVELSTRLCDGCGLPQRTHPSTGKLICLKRCSRCQGVFYHDEECQKRHFPEHRSACRALMKKLEQSKARLPAFRVETSNSKGRYTIACRDIRTGDNISPESSFLPLTPPVLTLEHRASRCAVCFGRRLQSSSKYERSLTNNPKYPVYLCSPECYMTSQPWLAQEEQMIAALCAQLPRSAVILPTAVLLFRIISCICNGKWPQSIARPDMRSVLDDLQTPEQNLNMSDEERNHESAIVNLTMRLLMLSDALDGYPCTEDIVELLGKVKINAFSVCDGESNSIGLGLFERVTNINHSCRPNALQTFIYGSKGRVPVLETIACRNIASGDEICISYIDSSPPRHVRRATLGRGYQFRCQCELCLDDDYNDTLMGFQCKACDGMIKQIRQEDGESSVWQCDACGSSEVADVLAAAKTFESAPQQSVDCAEDSYRVFQTLCSPTSWYARESGERLLSALLHTISTADSDAVKGRLCSQALSVAEELLRCYSEVERTSHGVIRYNVLRFKIAKLRLYLDPDPSRSLGGLQDVQKSLSEFLPESHELMMELLECLQQGYMH